MRSTHVSNVTPAATYLCAFGSEGAGRYFCLSSGASIASAELRFIRGVGGDMKRLPDEADPRENLSSLRAIRKIRDLAQSARVCLFGTVARNAPLVVRPMAVQDVDDEGNLWFLSGKSSAKNRQIGRNTRVQLLFANVGNSEFLNLHGTATISKDRELIKAHWTPIAKTWFHDGIDDPETTVIKVRVKSGYYWNTEHGKVVAMLSIALGTLTGKTLDDSVEGTVSPKSKRASRSRSTSRTK
ncbi:MAG: pyridoxamine 5'-phosphate oxidase family protein [Opitutaceae bacterium]